VGRGGRYHGAMTTAAVLSSLCDVCARAPAVSNSGEQSFACCKRCGRLVQPNFTDKAPLPDRDLVRSVSALLHAFESAQFDRASLQNEAAACRAIKGALRRDKAFWESRAITAIPRPQCVRFEVVDRRRRLPDIAISGASSTIAVEVKVTQGRSSDSSEISRGLGQCLIYCNGFTLESDPHPYNAAALLVIEKRKKLRDSTSIRNVTCLRSDDGSFYWLYYLHRAVRTDE